LTSKATPRQTLTIQEGVLMRQALAYVFAGITTAAVVYVFLVLSSAYKEFSDLPKDQRIYAAPANLYKYKGRFAIFAIIFSIDAIVLLAVAAMTPK
jgi:hypothetical protein